ncbi:MAG: hypothetical protein IJY65_04465 [Clostridia bacterium]|nr:hypothetical protein [Clostridia bacterium]
MIREIYSGKVGKFHCQGIAVDEIGGYIYYSFTTSLVKCTLDGTVVGTVENIAGHLGCIDWNERERRIYASLEYKNDAIGKGILRGLGRSSDELDVGFYIAIFDGDLIDRIGMDAERDGVMRAAYLSTVVSDYSGSYVVEGRELLHIHGCSGIDGIAFGPDFGASDGREYLHVCYGIYSDTERLDNDYQVILQYEPDELLGTALPLLQKNMHKIGPHEPRNRYFLYTGNTSWGIQNLEYDAFSNSYFAAVYRGKKPQFPNYPMFVIDAVARPVVAELSGLNMRGKTLTLKDTGLSSGGISGMEFSLGSTGIYSFGNGYFYFSVPKKDENGYQSSTAKLYRLDTEGKWSFYEV